MIRTLTLLLLVAVVATACTSDYASAIAHSPGAWVIAAILTPGAFLIFFDVVSSEGAAFAAAVMINLAYYFVLFWIVGKLRGARKVT